MINPHTVEGIVTEAGLALSGIAWIIKNVSADIMDMYYELKERKAKFARIERPLRRSLKSLKKGGHV